MKTRILFACMIMASGALRAAAASDAVSGTWTAEVSTAQPRELNIALHPQGSRNNTWGHDLPIGELQGFSGKDGEARFSLAREAGTFQFDGSFRDGTGAGHYTFAPSATYDSEMSALGISGSPSEPPAFLAFLNIGPRLAKEYRELGFEKLAWDELIAFSIHGVNPGQVKELRALGLAMREPQSLINFRIHGVSPEFVRELRKAGLDAKSEERLIELRIHGVTPEFVRDIRKAGLAARTEEKLVELRIHGVTPEFVGELKDLGVSMNDEQAVAMRIHGVTPSYVRRLREAGYTKAGPDDFVRLRISGFDEEMAGDHGKRDKGDDDE